MAKMTIGAYIPRNSWLHNLDVRSKLVTLALLIIAIFIVDSIFVHIGIFAGLIIVTSTSKISPIKMFNGLKQILILLVFTFSLQLLTIKDGELLQEFNFNLSIITIGLVLLIMVVYKLTKSRIHFRTTYFFIAFFLVFYVQTFDDAHAFFSYNVEVYDKALEKMVFIFFRIFNVIIASSLLTFTTSPRDLNEGIEYWLKPIPFVPEEVISRAISTSLRMIPKLFDESTKILKAQASRGVEFTESSLKQKVSQIVSLLVPMLILTLNISTDLANSMYVRGYVIGGKRTKLHTLKSSFKDIIPILVVVILILYIIGLNYIIWVITTAILTMIYIMKKAIVKNEN